MRIACLGAGSIGSRHIRNLITLGIPAEDILVFDPSQDAIHTLPSGVWGVPTAPVDSAIIRPVHDQWDALLICTPAATHAKYVKQAIAARIPVFVEKPAALGTHELTEAEWSTDVPHLVGYNWRFNRSYDVIRVMFESMPDAMASLICHTDMSTWPGRLSMSTPIFECSHEIDLALSWLGWDGAVDVSYLSVLYHGRVRLRLTKGDRIVTVTLAWNRPAERSAAVYEGNGDGKWLAEPSQRSIDHSYVAELQHFIDVARGSARSCTTLKQSHAVITICEQAEAAVTA